MGLQTGRAWSLCVVIESAAHTGGRWLAAALKTMGRAAEEGEDWHCEHICAASAAGCVGGVAIETRTCCDWLYRVLIHWKLQRL